MALYRPTLGEPPPTWIWFVASAATMRPPESKGSRMRLDAHVARTSPSLPGRRRRRPSWCSARRSSPARRDGRGAAVARARRPPWRARGLLVLAGAAAVGAAEAAAGAGREAGAALLVQAPSNTASARSRAVTRRRASIGCSPLQRAAVARASNTRRRYRRRARGRARRPRFRGVYSSPGRRAMIASVRSRLWRTAPTRIVAEPSESWPKSSGAAPCRSRRALLRPRVYKALRRPRSV